LFIAPSRYKPTLFGKLDMPVEELPWQPKTLAVDIKTYVSGDSGKKLLNADGLPFGSYAALF